MRKKLILFLSCISIVIFIFTGCATKVDSTQVYEDPYPKGDPTQVVNDYIENMKCSNYESAYDMLSEASKKNWSKEEFIYLNKIFNERRIYNEIKSEKSNEYNYADLEGTTYKNIIKYNVLEKDQDLYENKEVSFDLIMYVVNDNGNWKVYWGKENPKDRIANECVCLASMYEEGKGKPKDLNMAASVLNDALRYCKDCPGVYHQLGIIYMKLKRYDDALEAFKDFILMAKDNNDKSDGYNLEGCVYMYKGQMYIAREYFNKALELNPDNKQAKNNLSSMK